MSQNSCMSDTAGCENGFSEEGQNNSNESKKFKFVHPRDGSDKYMHLERRYAYIFDLAQNTDSATDIRHLVILLRNKLCFYVVEEKTNQNELLQTKIPNIVANSSHLEDSVLVCLLYNEPSSTDHKITDIWKEFMNCEKLATKPKMFLFVEYNNRNRIDSDGKRNKKEKVLHIPSHSDFILIHGFGNSYVKVLCEVVTELAHTEDLVSMITYTQATLAEENHSTKIPFFNNLLTHDVVFKLPDGDVTDNQLQEKGEKYERIVLKRRQLMNESPSTLAKRTLANIELYWEKLKNDPTKEYVEVAKRKIEECLEKDPPTDTNILREHVKVANSFLEKYVLIR